MTCKKIKEEILDNNQSFLDRKIREHLEVCPCCHRFHDEMTKLEKLHRCLAKRDSAPLDFSRQVFNSFSRGTRLNFSVVAATGFLLAVFAITIGIEIPAPAPPSKKLFNQIKPSIPPPASLLPEQAQSVEFDVNYPLIQINVTDPEILLTLKNTSTSRKGPINHSQGDYFKYVSH